MRPVIICPQCKAEHSPRLWKAKQIRCSCGHVWEPDRFDNLTLTFERAGLSSEGHYDKHGLPISIGEWARRFEDDTYKSVAVTNFGPLVVSTVWIGIDHNHARLSFPDDPRVDQRPIIFETMIFFVEGNYGWSCDEKKHELAGTMWRWHTLEEAVAGHEQAVQFVKDNILPPEAEEWIRNVLTEVNHDTD